MDPDDPDAADEIDLSEKELTAIPMLVFELDLENITTLCFEGNSIESIPEQIGNMSYVEELYLRRNAIKALPSRIGEMEALDSLYLEDNELTAEGIPATIGELSNLKGLCLHRNKLTVSRLDQSRSA